MKHLVSARIVGALLALAAAQSLEAQGPPYDAVRFAEDVMVPMRDGVRLATDI